MEFLKEEIAAEILSELKNCSEIPPQSSSKRRAKKSSSSSKRGPRSASSAAQKYVSVAPVGFELKGPWQPQNGQEEGEYTNFLNKLVSSNNNITYWTHSRLKKSVAAIFGVLHQAPFGLPRIELRNYARAFVGDTGLLDYTIKVLVNMELCGFFMKRETNPESGKLLYYVEYVDEERKREHQAFRSQAVVVEKKEFPEEVRGLQVNDQYHEATQEEIHCSSRPRRCSRKPSPTAARRRLREEAREGERGPREANRGQ